MSTKHNDLYERPETYLLCLALEGNLLTGSYTGENVTEDSEYDPW